MDTVGSGKYTYTEIRDWARLPEGEQWGVYVVEGVATDSRGRLYASRRVGDEQSPVLIFDQEGACVSSWGNGAFKEVHGLSVSSDILYICDRDYSVCMKYSLDGKLIQLFGQHGVHSDTGCTLTTGLPLKPVPRAAGPFNYPTQMVPDSDGDLYVSDGYRNARVHRFSPEGRLRFSWGEAGKGGPGQFHLVHSLAIFEGLIYVCDRENGRIQIFTTEGEPVSMWPGLNRPLHISVDGEGTVYVSEGAVPDAAERLSVLDRKGSLLARFGIRGGHGSCVDLNGDIYIGLGNPPESGRLGGVDKYVRQR